MTNFLDGTSLYGDDLDEAGVRAWFAAEEKGYYDLASGDGEYGGTGWSAIIDYHLFKNLPDRQYRHALALGCADGSELLPVARSIDRITAIEPAKEWWRNEIGGVPTEYRMPTIMGDIDAREGTFDLVVTFGVLHHIPNVSHVLAELTRVTAPGGLLAIREPIFSMGNWAEPRKGLTANERGLPLPWLRTLLSDKLHLKIRHESLCSFPPAARIVEKVGIKRPYSSKGYVLLDSMLSSIFAFNYSYHRTKIWRRFAPTAVAIIAQK